MHLPKTYIPLKVSVLGAARSGIAAALYLSDKGIPVFISDTCSPEKLEKTLAAHGCAHLAHEADTHTDRVLDADVIILSPGVPSNVPILLEAHSRGIAVWSEIELAYRFTDAVFLALTGSSGKSTTVSLLGAILAEAGVKHVVAGNIGVPLISVVPELGPDAFVVAEISSFQLENTDLFKPHIAAVINLMKNHLDRYDSEDAYYNAKKTIAARCNAEDFLLLNANDKRLMQWVPEFSGKTALLYFGKNMPGSNCAWFENNTLRLRFNGYTESILDVSTMKLAGRHNYDNACTAAIMAKAAGINSSAIAKGLAAFEGLAHRLEYVAEVGGVRYFNDSKSTTAESILCAVSAFGSNVFLIAGGRDKGCDFSVVNEALTRYVKGICLIGEAAARMEQEWSGFAPVVRADSLEAALEGVRSKAVSGDVIVFSPGCSSFDMFNNYEHRGDVFKKLIHAFERQDR
jgi:UDP-N-acetylmuramoylalanine--D-glutamate ligase